MSSHEHDDQNASKPVETGRRSTGRRKVDQLPRTDITKRLLVAVVALINFLYLVVQAFLDYKLK